MQNKEKAEKAGHKIKSHKIWVIIEVLTDLLPPSGQN